jgi:signal transduction histidine kinase
MSRLPSNEMLVSDQALLTFAPVSSLEPARELVGAIQRLSLARSLLEIQEIVRSAARRLSGADGATFVLRDGDQCYYADEEAISPLWKGQRFPLEACISGWAMLNRTHAVIPDIYADERIPHDAYRPTFVNSLVMVPIRTLDPVGAIGTYWATPTQPTERDVELLQALADSTAVAMENVRVYEALEDRVRARTAELEVRTRELERANERLVELDALRTRFAHTTTHELRSPLTAIQGFASLLEARLPEPEARHAAIIRESAARMSALVKDLLEIAELDQRDLELQQTRVQVADLVAVAIQGARPAAAEHGVELAAEIADGISIEADPVRCAQLLDNLISNAIKYTRPGGHVHVRASAQDGEAIVEVVDDGIGIDDADKPYVFDPFFRAAPGREVADGTGLGLSISRDIAIAHGGTLAVLDTRGGGATFRLILPQAPTG